MRITFLNIIFLILIIFTCEMSQASRFAEENENPSLSHGQLSCLECHPGINENFNNDKAVEFENLSLFPHANISCLECHKDAAMIDHENQEKTDCLDCHVRHHEKVAHDAHIDIPCGSCHLYDMKPSKVLDGNRIVWGYTGDADGEYNPHRVISEKNDICLRCHFRGNNLRAPDHVIPAKSIVCMPCHASTLSAGDIPSLAAIIVFFIGIAGILFAWVSGGKGYGKRKKINLTGLVNIFKTSILDGLFQRRLLNVSVRRWVIHSIIFFPFIFRFVWGIVALILSLHYPDWNSTWSMLDKNNPVTGFLFDFSGMLILLGGCLMVLEKRAGKAKNKIQDLPKSKPYIHILIGLIIITGFLLEGARIAMTGSPDGSESAFIGYGISRLLVNLDMQVVYIYFWYVHAFINGLFIACLPFSRMVHVVVAPFSVAIKSASGEGKKIKK